MANEISTAGISLSYATEASAGTRPTTKTAYTALTNIKGIGDLNPEPASYDVTDLSDTEYKRYIGALKDVGGAIAISVNMTESFVNAWNTMCDTAATAYASNKSTWFVVQIPNWTNSFYFAGIPAKCGLSAVDTDGVFEGDVYITPNEVVGWAAKPTT